jgi:hypothetical protein
MMNKKGLKKVETLDLNLMAKGTAKIRYSKYVLCNAVIVKFMYSKV